MIYKDINGVRIELEGAKRFTGILDRNKKEIFEDDIILMDTEDFLGKFKVVFIDGSECNFCGGSLSSFNLELIEKVDVDGYKYIEDSYFDIIES